METLFYEELALADTSFAELNYKFSSVIAESVESGLVTESEKDSLLVKTKKIIADIISALQNFIESIRIEATKRIDSAKMKAEVKRQYDIVKNSDPNKEYEIPDYRSILKEYDSVTSKLSKIVDRFTKKEYKYTEEIETDISTFNKIMQESEDTLKSVLDKKIKVKGRDYLRFIEDQMTKRDFTLKKVTEQKALLEQLKLACDRTETKLAILGPDVLAKKVGFLRKIAMNISSFIRRWAAKVISTIVFVFA